MTYYRLYLLNGSHIESALEIEADSDEDAIRIAGSDSVSQTRELWCGSRRVHTFEAAPDCPELRRAAE